MVVDGLELSYKAVVYKPPPLLTGTYCPFCILEAMVVSSRSPEAKASCSSLKKTVSPSGVNMTSPKMSSKLSVAGVPRCPSAEAYMGFLDMLTKRIQSKNDQEKEKGKMEPIQVL
mmetsp:Transcript_5790/g.16745  ORF Transcript_5790/g.16745 Transcript_5790/m.16745 type:complete len:115 (-) Transcript_5790:65-409(-)